MSNRTVLREEGSLLPPTAAEPPPILPGVTLVRAVRAYASFLRSDSLQQHSRTSEQTHGRPSPVLLLPLKSVNN